MGLTPDGRALFKSLLVEQRTNSIPYQVVNGIGSNKPIDKVVSQFEDIFFAESEYEFDHKEEEVSIEILNLESKKEKKVKEIEGLNQKNNHQKLLDEQTKLETNVATLVTALKNDLRTPGVGGRKFFDLIIKILQMKYIHLLHQLLLKLMDQLSKLVILRMVNLILILFM